MTIHARLAAANAIGSNGLSRRVRRDAFDLRETFEARGGGQGAFVLYS
jgi:hypothetical protein